MVSVNHHPGSTSGTEDKGRFSASVRLARLEGPSTAGTKSDESISVCPCFVEESMQAVVGDTLVIVSRNEANIPSKEEGQDESIASQAEMVLEAPVDAVGSGISCIASDGKDVCGKCNAHVFVES